MQCPWSAIDLTACVGKPHRKAKRTTESKASRCLASKLYGSEVGLAASLSLTTIGVNCRRSVILGGWRHYQALKIWETRDPVMLNLSPISASV
jgi:hypothetical protein